LASDKKESFEQNDLRAIQMRQEPSLEKMPVCGRFAPSPTGYLHLGNAWAFLCAWLGARSHGGSLVMRIEDIDPKRSKAEYVRALLEDLRWLGLDWDAGPDTTREGRAYYQSNRQENYLEGIRRLEANGLIYPCFCTRKELRELAGAPHAGAREEIYSGKCRTLHQLEVERKKAAGQSGSLRVRFEERLYPEFLQVEDLVLGRHAFTPGQAGGDFAVRRSDGVFAYQLAVVLDDIAMGVNQVVRGVDILGSVPRQKFLYSVLEAQLPEFAHIPLVLDHKGERLAKRHAALSLRQLRAGGIKPEAVLGYLAFWSGLSSDLRPISAGELLADFDFSRIRRMPGLLPEHIIKVLSGI